MKTFILLEIASIILAFVVICVLVLFNLPRESGLDNSMKVIFLIYIKLN
jgi:hypothetical protein